MNSKERTNAGTGILESGHALKGINLSVNGHDLFYCNTSKIQAVSCSLVLCIILFQLGQMSWARHSGKWEKEVAFPTSSENQEQTPEVQLIPCAVSLELTASLALATLEGQGSPQRHLEL